MGKIIAIDYGIKRSGLAITDSLQMIGSPLATVDTSGLFVYLDDLLQRESIVCLVVGEVFRLNNERSETTQTLDDFVVKLAQRYPHIRIDRTSEMFTSVMAGQALITGGMSKQKRRQKGNLDKVAAAIMLQHYLDMRKKQTDAG